MNFKVNRREGLVLKNVYVVQVLVDNKWVDVGTDANGSTKTSVHYPTYEEAADHMLHLINITNKTKSDINKKKIVNKSGFLSFIKRLFGISN